MNIYSFKQDIDELILEFVKGEFMSLADMKQIWLSRKFSYIFQASPKTNHGFFMQTLYAHSIGYMVSSDSLSRRLGGLYCLYCLYETQPFKPPFKIYLSIGELKRLRSLVVEAKQQGVKVVPTLVKRMLEKNLYLFGSVDLNEGSKTVNKFTELQNARLKLAYDKLFGDTRIEQFLHMDMGMEFDLDMLKKMSADYAEVKKQAIKEAGEMVDVQNIQHISDEKELIGDTAEKITQNWNAQRELFYKQIGLNKRRAEQNPNQDGQMGVEEDDFCHELELQLREDMEFQKPENEELSHEEGIDGMNMQKKIDTTLLRCLPEWHGRLHFITDHTGDELMILKPKRYGVEHRESCGGGDEYIYHFQRTCSQPCTKKLEQVPTMATSKTH